MIDSNVEVEGGSTSTGKRKRSNPEIVHGLYYNFVKCLEITHVSSWSSV